MFNKNVSKVQGWAETLICAWNLKSFREITCGGVHVAEKNSWSFRNEFKGKTFYFKSATNS